MTSNYHTPIPSSPKQPANAATVNAPLSQLDTKITNLEGRLTTEEGKVTLSHVAGEFVNSNGACSVPTGTGSTNGHVIQDEGVDQTQRIKLNFTGSGVTVVDTPSATEVQISSGGVTDHGALTGLLDPDHVSGSIAFSATDKLLGRATAGAGAGEEIPLSAAGRALIDDADAAAQRATLGLGNSATKDTGTGSTQVAVGNHTHESSAFWTTVPGTPTRVSDTQFTITDTGGANGYASLFQKGVILKWDEGGTFQTAMVQSSSYAANAVTINIVGDSLTAGFTAMKYCANKALIYEFIIAGTIGIGTDLARTHYPECNIYRLCVDARVKVPGTTNATVFDVNDDGVTIITTKPSIASGAASDLDNVCDTPSTVIAANSAITVDVDSVSTTPPVEAYLYLFYYPEWWRYLA